MLTLWGDRQRFCDGITRRNFLRIGAFGAGLSLAEMYRLRAVAAAGAGTSTSSKSAIMIYLPGGPSHMDMYDLKPNAPKEFRGEFSPIPTNVPGVEICELFPAQARMWDKLSVVRSVVATDEHSDSAVMTGYSERENRTAAHPSFGAVVSKLRGDSGGTVPPFVSLRGMSRGTEPGYLGVSHRPFTPSGPGLENLKLAGGVNAGRMDDRRSLLARFDDVRREIDDSGTMAGLDSFSERAFEMVASGAVHKALDLSREDPKTRDRYKGCEQFLTARRLVEAGVGLVHVNWFRAPDEPTDAPCWDSHVNETARLKTALGPTADRAFAALLDDLSDRGLLESTLVMCLSEFGRTPKFNGRGGRDHWGHVFSVALAGGGVKGGTVIGASDKTGAYPKDGRVSPADLTATALHCLGYDPATDIHDTLGRPFPASRGTVIRGAV